MAEAQGKLSGRPGICFVTRGPGASNAAIGIHTAFQDSTPLVLFIGQVASEQRDREAFQEVDYRQMFGPGTLGFAKWVAEVHDADRLPEYVARAFHTAMQGRPGPVVLALPEDMLRVMTAAPVLPRIEPALAAPAPEALAASARAARRRRAAVRHRRRQRLDAVVVRSPAALRRALAAAGGLRLPLPGRVRQPPSELRRRRRHRHQSEARRAHRRGRPGARDRPAPRRDDDRRLRAAARRRGRRRSWCTCTPAPRSSAGSTPATCCCSRRWPAPRRRWRRSSAPPSPRWAEWTRAAAADYEANRQPTPVAPLDMAEVVKTLARHLPADTVLHQRRRQLQRLAAPLLSLPGAAPRRPHPARADLGGDGLRPAGRRRRGPARAAAHRRQHRRRRRLPDERPGAGDGDRPTARKQAAQHRRRQRHLRHDPHAPGARVPGPGLGQRPRQPRLRGAGPGLRLVRRRARRQHRRLRAGAAGGARVAAGRR